MPEINCRSEPGRFDLEKVRVPFIHEVTGDFGTLLYAGHDWANPQLARRSMELMAENVMPAVNRAIGGELQGLRV